MSEEGVVGGPISELAGSLNPIIYATPNYIFEPVRPSVSNKLPSVSPDYVTVRPRFITPFSTLSKNPLELGDAHPPQYPHSREPQAAAPEAVLQPKPAVGMAKSTFPQFSKLPTEIRLMIWKAALPGPRIVEVSIGRLKNTLEDREVEPTNNEKSTSSAWDEFLTLDDQEAEGEVRRSENQRTPDEKAEGEARPTENGASPTEAPVLLGMRSSCEPPDVLFVNWEAHEVAAMYFEKAFPSDVTTTSPSRFRAPLKK
jgi:hypothetical protein